MKWQSPNELQGQHGLALWLLALLRPYVLVSFAQVLCTSLCDD